MAAVRELTAKMEPFDSFWEGPEDIGKGYSTLYKFYKYNYLAHFPDNRDIQILVISCGPGYFVDMLNRNGYQNVLGIDSMPAKVKHAQDRELNCIATDAFGYLERTGDSFDVIFCEQELNHLTKDEIIEFLNLVGTRIKPGGKLISHVLNGANPITGAEALAQNFDHYNTFTEYTFRQVLEYTNYRDIKIIPLHLYVFWKNPLNYILIALSSLYTLFFRISFIMYGKANRIFTKKIAAVCVKP
jgi:2-polyprenyl-3-methyl-5-hydroxy-6-metoxy-1,4-benzoquinol methylase